MAGLDPAIGYPHQIANDAIPVSNHPMEMTGSSPVMTMLGRCVRYVHTYNLRGCDRPTRQSLLQWHLPYK